MIATATLAALAPIIAGGAAAGGTVYGARRAGQSADRAARYQSDADERAFQIEQERDAEAKRQWEATEAQKAREFAAAEEERAYNRRLQEEREARQAPYRAASAAALGNLGQILGIDLSAQQERMLAPRMPRQAEPGTPSMPSPRIPNDFPGPIVFDGPMDTPPPPQGWGRGPNVPTMGDMIRLQPQRRLA